MVPLFHLCASSYPGVPKAGSWQWDSEGDESICDGLWGQEHSERGEHP